MTLSPNWKLAATALLFVLALITVALAAATSSYVPLFFTVFPLVAVAWVLTRGEPGGVPEPAPATGSPSPADPAAGDPQGDGTG